MTGRNTTRLDVAALVAVIVTVLVLLALTASTATAQIKLGKVKTAVTKAVIPAAVSPGAGGGIKTGNVTFDERVLEITAPRLEQFLAGLEAESEMAAKVNGQDLDAIDRQNAAAEAAYRADLDAYNAKKKEHERCSGAISQDLETQLAPDIPTEKDRAKLEAVAARIKAAKDAGNMTEVRRLMDSLVAAVTPAAQRMTARSNAAAARAGSECGPLPAKPASPARVTPLTWSDVVGAGQKASGMTLEQYQIFRERVAPYVVSQGKSSNMMYTATEVGALESKSDALGKFGHVFKEY
jgi:hypothetical protein